MPCPRGARLSAELGCAGDGHVLQGSGWSCDPCACHSANAICKKVANCRRGRERCLSRLALFPRCVFAENTLERSAVHVEPTRRLRDVATALLEDALDV